KVVVEKITARLGRLGRVRQDSPAVSRVGDGQLPRAREARYVASRGRRSCPCSLCGGRGACRDLACATGIPQAMGAPVRTGLPTVRFGSPWTRPALSFGPQG